MKESLYVMGLSNGHLICHKCKCGHLNIHGFWKQLESRGWVEVWKESKVACVHMPCQKCGWVWNKKYRLTAGKRIEKRMMDWTRLFWKVCRYLPRKAVRPACTVTLWLERFVRL